MAYAVSLWCANWLGVAVSVPGAACGRRCSAAAQRRWWSGLGVHAARESSRRAMCLRVGRARLVSFLNARRNPELQPRCGGGRI